MKLWLLKPIDERHPRWGYDTSHGFVVRAADEADARNIAKFRCGDEGPDVWLNSSVTSCERLKGQGDPAVILRDFNAG
jgi:hypothetical protein